MTPMITRRNDEDDTIRQYAFTMVSGRAKWTHEFKTKKDPSRGLPGIFCNAKDFGAAHEVAAGA